MRKIYSAFISLLLLSQLHASSIILNTKNATVWLPQQIITGKTKNLSSNKLKWHVNNASGNITIKQNGTFCFSIVLTATNNIIWADDSLYGATSDTIYYTLGYMPLPEVKPFAAIANNIATLDVKIIDNPYNLPLAYLWTCTKSPGFVAIQNKENSKAIAQIPNVNGDYFFTVTVFAGNDSAKYSTYITRNSTGLHAFDILTEHAAWIDSALIYEITPNVFVKDGQYPDITKKLTELKILGINTIWLQPVYKTHSGEQGYDVTNYLELRPDLGTEKEVKDLIAVAKNLSMRVLFDFVPNHTSIFHPYAEEVIQYGELSHYYNFYQHTKDGAKYSSQEQTDSLGFVHYFWRNLINIDYNNLEVRRWMIEAFKYWLQKFDIDGYRIDAVWALNARNPTFGNQLKTILKSIKPDILLLAEDKGALSSVYKEGYDAAYDWRADSNWISNWSWATDYNPPYNPTVFNYDNEKRRSLLLNNSFFSNGDTTHLRFRFLENNDQERFIIQHGKQRTKMAAALLFALPGIPMIYNGQEIGYERKNYSNRAIFKTNQTIQSLDTNNLFTWYQQLNNLRLQHDALRSNHMQSLPVNLKTLYALYRWQNNEHIIILVNLGSKDADALVNIKLIKKQTNNATVYIDLMTKQTFYSSNNATTLNVDMKKYSTRLLLASTTESACIAADK